MAEFKTIALKIFVSELAYELEIKINSDVYLHSFQKFKAPVEADKLQDDLLLRLRSAVEPVLVHLVV